MPAKKRTVSKGTPPASPTTSTSHADQHHRLRHTGPSITTRSRSAAASSKYTHLESTPESPPVQKSSSEKVSPPGARSSFTKFLYALLFLVLLLFGWYIHGMITLVDKLKEDVGWWGIIMGDSGGTSRRQTSEGWGQWGFGSDRSGRKDEQGEAVRGDLEGPLNAIAEALGISPMQVASAVRPLIPQASMASMASKLEQMSGSETVRILFEDTTRSDRENVKEFEEEFGRGTTEKNVAEGGLA